MWPAIIFNPLSRVGIRCPAPAFCVMGCGFLFSLLANLPKHLKVTCGHCSHTCYHGTYNHTLGSSGTLFTHIGSNCPRFIEFVLGCILSRNLAHCDHHGASSTYQSHRHRKITTARSALLQFLPPHTINVHNYRIHNNYAYQGKKSAHNYI